jgi:hypothetical protein
MNMKLRYRLFLRRKSVYYAFDTTTKTFSTLKTKNKVEATRMLVALNEAGQQPAMNLSLARVYQSTLGLVLPEVFDRYEEGAARVTMIFC